MNPTEPYPTAARNVVYAQLPSQQLLLDLYRPDTPRRVPVVVYFHSGGWRSGSKDICKVQWLTEYGFAVVSANYRLLPRYTFPEQVRDAKAVVRFLRARADRFGLEPEQIVATGLSSGAYLASMLGVTAGHPELDKPPPLVGYAEFADEPTHVNAVVNYHGFTDFLALQNDPTRRGQHRAARAPEGQLLGHAVADNLNRAKLASPIQHVREGLPPFLHLHGDRDEITPLDQTRRFHAALQDYGVTSKFTLVRGAGHRASQMFTSPSIRDRVADFLHRHLDTVGVRELSEESRLSDEARPPRPDDDTSSSEGSSITPALDDVFVTRSSKSQNAPQPSAPLPTTPPRDDVDTAETRRSPTGAAPAPPEPADPPTEPETKAWPYPPTPMPPKH
ncbi:MAG: alpha/beta hydrolase [Planctomycetota bacterium]